MPRNLLLAASLLGLAAGLPGPVAAAEVWFEINDAHVKDQPVAGVEILFAAEAGGDPATKAYSDEEGRARVDLAPGTYWVSYVRAGYVPIGDSETEIRADGQVVTTTMSMLLEAEAGAGAARRRVRIVLNWGSRPSQVRDADAHFYCACGAPDGHVYYADMSHQLGGHWVELDVDDREWGGPETVTLNAPEPGDYRYWVHQFSRDEEPLGRSDVVVRVFFDDSLAAELRIPPALTQRTWRPFRRITVGPDLEPELVRFTAEELANHADLVPPPGPLSEQSSSAGGLSVALPFVLFALGLGVLFRVIALVIRRRRR